MALKLHDFLIIKLIKLFENIKSECIFIFFASKISGGGGGGGQLPPCPPPPPPPAAYGLGLYTHAFATVVLKTTILLFEGR